MDIASSPEVKRSKKTVQTSQSPGCGCCILVVAALVAACVVTNYGRDDKELETVANSITWSPEEKKIFEKYRDIIKAKDATLNKKNPNITLPVPELQLEYDGFINQTTPVETVSPLRFYYY